MSDTELMALILDIIIVIFLLINAFYFFGIKKIVDRKMSFVMFLLLHPYQLHELREQHKADGCPICKEDEKKWKTTP